VIWGKNDPLFGPKGAEAFKRDVPNAEIHLLDTGHFVLEEDADAVARFLNGFMETLARKKKKQSPSVTSILSLAV